MRSWRAVILAILIVCSGVLGYATLSRGHDWGDDFATYILQAESIAQGHPSKFIEANRLTVERSTGIAFPLAAPWGTPLLLAPIFRHYGMNILALKSLNLVCYILFLVALVFLLRKRHSFAALALIVALFAFNPTLIAALEEVLSDIPFLLVSTLAVCLLGRVAVEGRPLFGKAGDAVLFGGLCAAAFFIRTNGVLLLATLLGIQLVKMRRGRRAEAREILFGILPYVVFAVLATGWSFIFPHGGSSHVRTMESFTLATIRHNLRAYATITADFFTGAPHHHAWYVASLPFLIAGIVVGARRDYHFLIYMVLTAALYLFWPGTQGVRYLIPLLPFYVHFVFLGGRAACDALKGLWRPVARVAAACVILVLCAFFVRSTISQAAANLRNGRAATSGPYAPVAQQMFRFVAEDTGTDAVIEFFKPRLMRMMTGRASVRIGDPAEVDRGDYVVYRIMEKPYGQLPLDDVMGLVARGRLVQVFANAEFRVYRVVHPVGTA